MIVKLQIALTVFFIYGYALHDEKPVYTEFTPYVTVTATGEGTTEVLSLTGSARSNPHLF